MFTYRNSFDELAEPFSVMSLNGKFNFSVSFSFWLM